MGNLSYHTLLERYRKLKDRTDSKADYYYYAYKDQVENNKKLKSEIKESKKEIIELSYLVTELMKKEK